tara:strand:- start:2828 stop:3586 length:759 start_codon:yes stop_codon:yes gene_type:complete
VLDSILAKEAADQWSIEHDIDWDLPIRYPFWFRRSTYIRTISQIYHGERLTQRACQRLLTEVDDPLVSQFLACQLADEQKHEAVFARYINLMGDIAPIEPAIKDPLEGSLAWQGSKLGSPLGVMISFHIVFEGGAVTVLDRLGRSLPCPLFRAINTKVMADEARHNAFGTKYVRDQLPNLSNEERLEIFAHVARLWLDCAKATENRYSIPIALVTRLKSNYLAENWERQKLQLIKIGLVTADEAMKTEASLR